MKKVHIGRIIEARLTESGMTRKSFATKIGVSQKHLYTIFERDHIDTGLLMKISQVHNYNFFSHFSGYQQDKQTSQVQESEQVLLKLEITIPTGASSDSILRAVKDRLVQMNDR